MAPDLNSVPASPRPQPVEPTLSTSRRTSQSIATPLPPSSSVMSNILPSNQSAVDGSSQSPPPVTSPGISNIGDNGGAGVGPGPLRHPRPMTASDIYLELEKEQEAVVNRLTRELSLLRAAQNASVVSNASSTSTGLPDTTDQNNNHLLSGASHPAPSMRHNHQRTSSSTSIRSNSNTILSPTSGAGIAAASSSERIPRQGISRTNSSTADLSRQNSMTSSRRSGASSPAPPTGSYQAADHFPSFYQHRPSPHPREASYTNLSHTSAPREFSDTNTPTTTATTTIPSARIEDVAFHRQELEAVKRENEMLRRRVRELERTVRERRQSDASRTRSESVSTTASGVGRTREGGNGKAEDEVRVGESARGGGLR